MAESLGEIQETMRKSLGLDSQGGFKGYFGRGFKRLILLPSWNDFWPAIGFMGIALIQKFRKPGVLQSEISGDEGCGLFGGSEIFDGVFD